MNAEILSLPKLNFEADRPAAAINMKICYVNGAKLISCNNHRHPFSEEETLDATIVWSLDLPRTTAPAWQSSSPPDSSSRPTQDLDSKSTRFDHTANIDIP
mgnify:CR=1 FL=1